VPTPPVAITYFTDPGCPWAYSATPALTVIRWRYADQLRWDVTTVGLADDPDRYVSRGYTPARSAQGYRRFRHYGMPFATAPRARIPATGPACRAIVATRQMAPEHVWAVLRELQFGWFTTPMVMDEVEALAQCLHNVAGLDADAVVSRLEDPDVETAYQSDKATARQAQGSPTDFQGKAANTDGLVRYTAPSLIISVGGRSLEAGGFQSLEAYDVLIANLDPTLDRRAPADDPLEALEFFTHGLTTLEVAACMTHNLKEPDPAAAEDALIALVGDGRADRRALGDDALWTVA
jgi:protein-disulfide isomerase-like protein with CxxC motif